MRTFVLSLALALGGAAFAAPCAPGSAVGYGDCSIDSLGQSWQIFDISWQTTQGSDLLPNSSVQLSPVSASGPGLAFDFGGTLTVPVGRVVAARFQYTIDPPPPILDGFGLSLDPTGTSQLVAVISYGVKTSTSTLGAPRFEPGLFDAIGFVLEGDQAEHYVLSDFKAFKFNANYVHVDLTIRIGGGDLDSTSNGGSTGAVATPEPAAFGFAGIGLAGLALLRRRMAR